MKMRFWIIYIICISSVLQSCDKEGNKRNTYITYSLNGATCNGVYRIDVDKDISSLEAVALLIPAANGSPEVVILTFYDYAENREVLFTLPVGKGVSNPFQLEYDSEFGMGILHGNQNWNLFSGVENTIYGVSIDVKKFKRGSGFLGFGSLEEFEVAFEGIMSFENEMHEIEQHTVKGDFYYKPQS